MKNWEHLKPEDRHTVQIARGGKPVSGIDPERISVVEEEVMYWRKANHIHGWFVDNVMDDGDQNDGRSYLVEEAHLRALAVVCDHVVKDSKLVKGTVYAGTVYDKEHPGGLALREAGRVIEDAAVAKNLLPRREGPFFGYYEYDEEYLNDVIDTQGWAVRMLADRKAGVPGEIYYSSSW